MDRARSAAGDSGRLGVHQPSLVTLPSTGSSATRWVSSSITSREAPPIPWRKKLAAPAAAPVQSDCSKLEPAEIFHEMLVHRWYLSERAGHEIPLLEAAPDYLENVLATKPDELVTADDALALDSVLDEDQDAGVL